MNLIDYSIFYKQKYKSVNDLHKYNYDVFISAYNSSTRVQKVFRHVNAKSKHWLVFSEYGYNSSELPVQPNCYISNIGDTEDETIVNFFDEINIDLVNSNICIDITGFIRPHLIFLARYLYLNKSKRVDFIYSDPITYVKKELTSFSEDYVEVRQISLCEGNHNPLITNDFLIIGSGYDSSRISDVAKTKANCKKVQLYGFPSLQPDMYQENILKSFKAEEATSDGRQVFVHPDFTIFAPANDPFITASLIQEFVLKQRKRKEITNLYLSPLATKAQTLGFALFYIAEGIDKPVSILFPFCENYAQETTSGLSKIWVYTVDFENIETYQTLGYSCFDV